MKHSKQTQVSAIISGIAIAAIVLGAVPFALPAPGTTVSTPSISRTASSAAAAPTVSRPRVNSTSPSASQPFAAPPAPIRPATPAQTVAAVTTPQTPPSTDHPVYPYHALLAPNDPGFGSQTYLSQIGAPTAWDTTTGSATTTIAVIDTGFALDHSDFAGRWYINPGEIGPTTQEGPAPNCTSRGLPLDKSCNNLDNDGDGYPSDWRGWNFVAATNTPQAGLTNPTSSVAFHGTFVAGLAAASGNNATGGAGINWKARIMPLQALSDDGQGDTNTVAAAVRYAADHGANVINMSLGSSYDDAYLHQQIDYAISKGVAVVAAAGNSGCAGCVNYPAAYPEVVAVGATDTSGNLASFSSYGSQIDLTAPGTNMCSTYWTATNPTGSFACGGAGTSFAAPLVSGAISLLMATGLSADVARQFVTLSATKVSGMGASERTDQFGFGQLNLATAMQEALAPPIRSANDAIVRLPCSDPAASTCTGTLINADGTVIAVSGLKGPPVPADHFYLDTTTPTAPPPGVYVLQTAGGEALGLPTLYFSP